MKVDDRFGDQQKSLLQREKEKHVGTDEIKIVTDISQKQHITPEKAKSLEKPVIL